MRSLISIGVPALLGTCANSTKLVRIPSMRKRTFSILFSDPGPYRWQRNCCLQEQRPQRESRGNLIGDRGCGQTRIDHPCAVLSRPIPGLPGDRRSSQGLWIYQAHLRGYRDKVREGQTIAVLEVPELQAQLEGTVAQVGERKDEIVRAQHDVARAEAEYASLPQTTPACRRRRKPSPD